MTPHIQIDMFLWRVGRRNLEEWRFNTYRNRTSIELDDKMGELWKILHDKLENTLRNILSEQL